MKDLKLLSNERYEAMRLTKSSANYRSELDNYFYSAIKLGAPYSNAINKHFEKYFCNFIITYHEDLREFYHSPIFDDFTKEYGDKYWDTPLYTLLQKAFASNTILPLLKSFLTAYPENSCLFELAVKSSFKYHIQANILSLNLFKGLEPAKQLTMLNEVKLHLNQPHIKFYLKLLSEYLDELKTLQTFDEREEFTRGFKSLFATIFTQLREEQIKAANKTTFAHQFLILLDQLNTIYKNQPQAIAADPSHISASSAAGPSSASSAAAPPTPKSNIISSQYHLLDNILGFFLAEDVKDIISIQKLSAHLDIIEHLKVDDLVGIALEYLEDNYGQYQQLLVSYLKEKRSREANREIDGEEKAVSEDEKISLLRSIDFGIKQKVARLQQELAELQSQKAIQVTQLTKENSQLTEENKKLTLEGSESKRALELALEKAEAQNARILKNFDKHQEDAQAKQKADADRIRSLETDKASLERKLISKDNEKAERIVELETENAALKAQLAKAAAQAEAQKAEYNDKKERYKSAILSGLNSNLAKGLAAAFAVGLAGNIVSYTLPNQVAQLGVLASAYIFPYIEIVPGLSNALPYITCTNLMLVATTVALGCVIIKGVDLYKEGGLTIYADAVKSVAEELAAPFMPAAR